MHDITSGRLGFFKSASLVAVPPRLLLVLVLGLVVTLASKTAAQTTSSPTCTQNEMLTCSVAAGHDVLALFCINTGPSTCDPAKLCNISQWQTFQICTEAIPCAMEMSTCHTQFQVCDAAFRAVLCATPAPPTLAPGSPPAPPATPAPTLSTAQNAAVLNEFYTACDGLQWRNNSGWSSTGGSDGSYCSWFGVACDVSKNVVGLSLKRNRLNCAKFPASFSTLTSLETADLSESIILGEISAFFPLIKLKKLILYMSALTAPCVFPYQGPGMEDCPGYPDGGLTFIMYKPEQYTNFTGDGTDLFHKLTNLEVLTVGGENLHMTMDSNFCRLKNLRYFAGQNLNNLKGTLPTCIDTMPRLTVFHCQLCGLHGTIPSQWSNCPSLRIFSVGQNLFEGQLPAFPPKVQLLNFISNKLTGTLPEAQPWVAPNDLVLADLMESMALASNNLSGTLPKSWGTMKNMKYIFLGSNRNLGGTFPIEWQNMKALLYTDLRETQLSGQLPDIFDKFYFNYNRSMIPPPFCIGCALEFPEALFPAGGINFSLVGFRASNTRLSGTIPQTLINHPTTEDIQLSHTLIRDVAANVLPSIANSSIKNLVFSQNQLSGTLDNARLCMIKSLRYLDLSDNQITGTIDACTWKLENLWFFGASKNQLHGTVPDADNVINSGLQVIRLGDNNLTGAVPNVFSNFTRLRTLEMARNQLGGPLTLSLSPLADLHDMTIINLDSNRFTGSFDLILFASVTPDDKFPYLTTLSIANNQLSGNIPDVFEVEVNELSYINLEGNNLSGDLPNLAHLTVLKTRNNPMMRGNNEELPNFIVPTSNFIEHNLLMSCPQLEDKAGHGMVISLDPSFYGYKYCRCNPGYYGTPPDCVDCIPGGICNNSKLTVPAGYFPTPNYQNVSYLIKCLPTTVRSDPSPCNPLQEPGGFVCLPGYKDRLCSECDNDHYHRYTKCVQCPSGAVVGIAFAIIIIGVIVIGVLLYFIPRGRREIISSLKVVIVFMQILNLIINGAQLRWPDSLMSLNRVFDISNFDVSMFSCLAKNASMSLPFTAEVQSIIILLILVICLIIFLVFLFELMNWIEENNDSKNSDSKGVSNSVSNNTNRIDVFVIEANDRGEASPQTDDGTPTRATATTTAAQASPANGNNAVDEDTSSRAGSFSNAIVALNNMELYDQGEWRTPSYQSALQAFHASECIFETSQDVAVKKLKRKYLLLRGFVTFLKYMYLPVTSNVMLMFHCEKDPATKLMHMHFSPAERCSFDSPQYGRRVILAVILIPLYVIGFPVFVKINANKYKQHHKVTINTLAYLFDEFRPAAADHLLWQLVRSLMLAVVVVLIPNDVGSPLLVTLLAICVAVHAHEQAYRMRLRQFTELVSLTTLTIIVGLGLTNSRIEESNPGLVTALILIVTISFFLLLIYCAVLHAYFNGERTAQAKKFPLHQLVINPPVLHAQGVGSSPTGSGSPSAALASALSYFGSNQSQPPSSGAQEMMVNNNNNNNTGMIGQQLTLRGSLKNMQLLNDSDILGMSTMDARMELEELDIVREKLDSLRTRLERKVMNERTPGSLAVTGTFNSDTGDTN